MNKSKNLTALALAAILFGAATSCQKAENKNTASNIPANNTAVVATTPASTPTETNSNPSSDTASGGPTEAYKAAYTARKNKDIAALKKLLSKDIIEFFVMMGNADEKKKQTVDEMLKELCDRPQAAVMQVRNEKITGDTATLEFIDEDSKWQTMDFIKEDGIWKLTIAREDKMAADDDSNGTGKPDSDVKGKPKK